MSRNTMDNSMWSPLCPYWFLLFLLHLALHSQKTLKRATVLWYGMHTSGHTVSYLTVEIIFLLETLKSFQLPKPWTWVCEILVDENSVPLLSFSCSYASTLFAPWTWLTITYRCGQPFRSLSSSFTIWYGIPQLFWILWAHCYSS